MIDYQAIAMQLGALALYATGGAWFMSRWQSRRAARGEPEPPRVPAAPAGFRDPPANLVERLRVADEAVRSLRSSLLQIPEIAQRLFSAKSVREIPDAALDLAEEMFSPAFVIFYSLRRGGYVATAVRGECEFPLGHRVELGQGIVGWTAVRQIPFTPEDAAHETRSVRERDLAVATPRAGFTVCAPIVSGSQTIGVLLVGPALREVGNPAEMARMIALLASAAETNVRLLEREQHLAKTDGLTGLLNKRAIHDLLRERVRPGQRGVVSIFLFDVDHFKKYNDTNGHLAGDDLLRSLGDLIREHSRDSEGLGRYGGEEFLLVMDGAPKAQALAAADRLRELVASAHLPFRESQPGGLLTISGGVATWPGDGDDAPSLLKAADDALYAAKRAGRNRVFAHHVPDLALAEDDESQEKSH